jgi:SAM-dependent methyltransferase
MASGSVLMGPSEGPLLRALAETGAIGSTARQLSERIARPLPTVTEHLESLSGEGRVLQIGRGLWILRDFERLEFQEGYVEPADYTERFQSENGVALGTYRGPITSATNDHASVHRWWPYVQSYSAAFVEGLLDASDLASGATVLDPFSGSGTTAVVARRNGLRGVGAELLPPAVLAARVKTDFGLSPAALSRAGEIVLTEAARRPRGRPPFLRETPKHFHPDVLDALIRLRDSLPHDRTPVGRAIRVAFGSILVPVSRLRRSPCLGYTGRDPLDPPDARAAFGTAVRTMVEDLERLRTERDRWGPPASIRRTDARRLRVPRETVQLAVTSPPYVNGMDYVMNYKLDLAWLGYVHTYPELIALRRSLIACDNLPRGDADGWLTIEDAPDPWLPDILRRIRANVALKRTYRRNDVHGIVKRYFTDLLPVLRNVYRSLVPGGRFVLVVGDSLIAGAYVPGDLLLARMGVALGFEIESVEIARPRRSGQRRSFVLRESIVTLRKPAHAG